MRKVVAQGRKVQLSAESVQSFARVCDETHVREPGYPLPTERARRRQDRDKFAEPEPLQRPIAGSQLHPRVHFRGVPVSVLWPVSAEAEVEKATVCLVGNQCRRPGEEGEARPSIWKRAPIKRVAWRSPDRQGLLGRQEHESCNSKRTHVLMPRRIEFVFHAVNDFDALLQLSVLPYVLAIAGSKGELRPGGQERTHVVRRGGRREHERREAISIAPEHNVRICAKKRIDETCDESTNMLVRVSPKASQLSMRAIVVTAKW